MGILDVGTEITTHNGGKLDQTINSQIQKPWYHILSLNFINLNTYTLNKH